MGTPKRIRSLTDDEVNLLKSMAEAERKRIRNPRVRGQQDAPDEPPSTGGHIVKTPDGGIPARTGLFPGRARCTVYQLLQDPTLTVGDDATEKFVNQGFEIDVYNICDEAVAGGVYIFVMKDKCGKWYAVRVCTPGAPAIFTSCCQMINDTRDDLIPQTMAEEFTLDFADMDYSVSGTQPASVTLAHTDPSPTFFTAPPGLSGPGSSVNWYWKDDGSGQLLLTRADSTQLYITGINTGCATLLDDGVGPGTTSTWFLYFLIQTTPTPDTTTGIWYGIPVNTIMTIDEDEVTVLSTCDHLEASWDWSDLLDQPSPTLGVEMGAATSGSLIAVL